MEVVYFDCWGLGGGEQMVSVGDWEYIEKGGQKLAAKTAISHLFAQKKDTPRKDQISPSSCLLGS